MLLLRLNSESERSTILLWLIIARHLSHMSLPYLTSDGLVFFSFLLCVVPPGCYCGLISKSKGSVLLSSLVGNYQKFYLFISNLAFW